MNSGAATGRLTIEARTRGLQLGQSRHRPAHYRPIRDLQSDLLANAPECSTLEIKLSSTAIDRKHLALAGKSLEPKFSGRLSDNLFDVLPGESIVVTFTPDDPKAFPAGPQDFVLRDLHSSYASRRV